MTARALSYSEQGPTSIRSVNREIVYKAFQGYLSCGMSVLPLYPGTKKPYTEVLPGGKWGVYSQRRASEEEIKGWCLANPLPDIGVILGAISGELTAYDIEKYLFRDWLFRRCKDILLEKTWVTQTGSGLLHVFLRSEKPVTTHNTNVPEHWPHEDGSTKNNWSLLVEVRSNNKGGAASYVAVPPSGHPDGGTYRNLFNNPRAVRLVPDAGGTFDRLTEVFKQDFLSAIQQRGLPQTVHALGGIVPPEAQSVEQRGQDLDINSVPKSVLAPLLGADRDALLYKLRTAGFDSNSLVIIERGAEWNRTADEKAPDHSKIDYHICQNLRVLGWSWDQIEQLYASFPVGKYTYQNVDRSDHGRRYLWYTLQNVDKRIVEVRNASRVAKGSDFDIKSARLFPYDEDPYYELDIVMSDGVTDTARVHSDDLCSWRRFHTAVFRTTGFVLHFLPEQMKTAGWIDFQAGVSRLTEKMSILVTRYGNQEDILRDLIKHNLLKKRPTKSTYSLGWAEQHYFYIDVSYLVSLAHSQGHKEIKTSVVDEVLRRWNAADARPRIEGNRRALLKVSNAYLFKDSVPDDEDDEVEESPVD